MFHVVELTTEDEKAENGICEDGDMSNIDEEENISINRRGEKKRWSAEDCLTLRKHFQTRLKEKNRISTRSIKKVMHKLKDVRTIPQIRTKLNNIKLGKSN